jgi:hypothetical protein
LDLLIYTDGQERGFVALKKVEFARVVQRERGTEDLHIELFSDEQMTQMHLVAKDIGSELQWNL